MPEDPTFRFWIPARSLDRVRELLRAGRPRFELRPVHRLLLEIKQSHRAAGVRSLVLVQNDSRSTLSAARNASALGRRKSQFLAAR
jgi:hypothetical protein